jgi:glycine cleavage system H protein
MGQYQAPDPWLFTKMHVYTRKCRCIECGEWVVGLTEYAVRTLGESIFVSLPSRDDVLTQSVPFGTIKSAKAEMELFSPFSGNVTRVNSDLATHPELVTQSPYEKGWFFRMEPSDVEREKVSLLNAAEYWKMMAAKQPVSPS